MYMNFSNWKYSNNFTQLIFSYTQNKRWLWDFKSRLLGCDLLVIKLKENGFYKYKNRKFACYELIIIMFYVKDEK